MTVILDTNIWLAYLLTPLGKTTINRVVDTCLRGPLELVVPQELIAELFEKVTQKSYLRERIALEDVRSLVSDLQRIATILEPVRTQQFSFEPDPDDEYLLTQGLLSNTEYLVTGDNALLELTQVEALKIVRPAQFLKLVHRQSSR